MLDRCEMAILAAASRRGDIELCIGDLKVPEKEEAPGIAELLGRIMPKGVGPILTLQLR